MSGCSRPAASSFPCSAPRPTGWRSTRGSSGPRRPYHCSWSRSCWAPFSCCSGSSMLVLLVTVYCVFPVYFVLVQSLKSAKEDVFGNPLIVLHPSFENFEELFEAREGSRGFVGAALRRSYPFLDWLGNTLFVFAGTLALTLSLSLAAAYALGRLQPPGFRWWRRTIFATYVIPQTILFVP